MSVYISRNVIAHGYQTQTRRLHHLRKHLLSRKTSKTGASLSCVAPSETNQSQRRREPKYRIMATLETLNFDNLALRSLPIDSEKSNYVRQVSGACFSKVKPTPVKNAETVVFSSQAMQLLDLPKSELERSDFAEYLSGSKVLPGADPAAHCYCGHQFGFFAGQLGDGATMYLGEVVNKKGERWEIQFKGAGLTPYSRTADGRKVLRSSLREFLCSEALHHLGIPTTRAGSCVTSDTKVIRDIFYSGNPIEEKCTIILRIAPSFLRFGSFEIFKPVDDRSGRKGPSAGKTDILQQLLEYTISTFYPEIHTAYKDNKDQKYRAFFKEVVRRTARLVALWQCVGWCHGVLNTDNMSILGLTIDYGPFGFMDKFDPGFICNSSDDGGRYTYENQPEICWWNCTKLLEILQQVVDLQDDTDAYRDLYWQEYEQTYISKMRSKLGLIQKELPGDKELTASFLETLEQTGGDFTNSFRCLSTMSLPGSSDHESHQRAVLEALLSQCATLEELIKSSGPRMDPRQFQMLLMLMQMNPGLLEQMGKSQGALIRELKQMEEVEELKKMKPEDKLKENKAKWSKWLSLYTERLKQEAEGVTDVEAANKERVKAMNNSNPRFVLRNYIAQNAIDAAEKGDYSEVQNVLTLLENPYSDLADISALLQLEPKEGTSVASTDTDVAGTSTSSASCRHEKVAMTKYDGKPPSWAFELRVT